MAYSAPNTDRLNFVASEIDKIKDQLYTQINQPIHSHPELGFEEFNAHDVLTSFYESLPNWTVTRSAFGLATLFEAVFQHKADAPGATVGSFNAEYDALPGIGHACGHNLIATTTVLLSVLALALLVRFDIPGTIKVFGTPAEEGGGGKNKLLELGLFKTLEFSMMLHPSSASPGVAWCHTTLCQNLACEFFGKAAHLAQDPWDGINALDLQVVYYTCVSVLRQQLQPGDIVQGNIVSGGAAPNIISDYTKNNINIRARSRKRLAELVERVTNCVKLLSLLTGCTYKVSYLPQYYDLISNDPMADVYRDCYNTLSLADGAPFLQSAERERITGESGASTDQGNVSYLLPAIHPMFAIDSPDGSNHNEHFTQLAGTRLLHERGMKALTSMLATFMEVMLSRELLAKVRALWELDMKEHDPDA